MNPYTVSWTADVDAETPLDAARQAFDMIRRPDTTANVFDVSCDGLPRSMGIRVDLTEAAESLPDWFEISDDPGTDYVIDFARFLGGGKDHAMPLYVEHDEAVAFGVWHSDAVGSRSEFLDVLDRARTMIHQTIAEQAARQPR